MFSSKRGREERVSCYSKIVQSDLSFTLFCLHWVTQRFSFDFTGNSIWTDCDDLRERHIRTTITSRPSAHKARLSTTLQDRFAFILSERGLVYLKKKKSSVLQNTNSRKLCYLFSSLPTGAFHNPPSHILKNTVKPWFMYSSIYVLLIYVLFFLNILL